MQLRAAVVDLGDAGQQQQRLAGRAPPTAARSRPTAASISASAAARRSGSVPSSVLRGPGSPASVSSSSETSDERAAGQQAGELPARTAGVGAGDLHPGRRRRRGWRRARTPWRSRPRPPARRARRRSGRCPRRRRCARRPRPDRPARLVAARSWRPQWASVVSTAGSGAPSVVGGVGVGAAGSSGQGHGRQRHRRQALVGAGHAGPVAGAEGRPAVQQAGRRAGGPHRHRADRGLPRQVPQLRRGRRIDVVPGQARDADDEHPVGGVLARRPPRRRRAAGRRGAPRAGGAGRPPGGLSSAGPHAAARAARGRGPPAAGRCRPRRATSPPGGGRPRPAVRRARGR